MEICTIVILVADMSLKPVVKDSNGRRKRERGREGAWEYKESIEIVLSHWLEQPNQAALDDSSLVPEIATPDTRKLPQSVLSIVAPETY